MRKTWATRGRRALAAGAVAAIGATTGATGLAPPALAAPTTERISSTRTGGPPAERGHLRAGPRNGTTRRVNLGPNGVQANG
jgi:hypothetical protein